MDNRRCLTPCSINGRATGREFGREFGRGAIVDFDETFGGHPLRELVDEQWFEPVADEPETPKAGGGRRRRRRTQEDG